MISRIRRLVAGLVAGSSPESRAALSMALRTPAGAYFFGGSFCRSASRSFMCLSRKVLRSL